MLTLSGLNTRYQADVCYQLSYPGLDYFIRLVVSPSVKTFLCLKCNCKINDSISNRLSCLLTYYVHIVLLYENGPALWKKDKIRVVYFLSFENKFETLSRKDSSVFVQVCCRHRGTLDRWTEGQTDWWTEENVGLNWGVSLSNFRGKGSSFFPV